MGDKMTPCVHEYSTGNGNGVAEAIGNWGFSNRVANKGHEMERLKCLVAKIDNLKSSKPMNRVHYYFQNDPEAKCARLGPPECKPVWYFPYKRPLITYSSTALTIVGSDLNRISADFTYPIPERNYKYQNNDKWYRRGPDCCPQPSCLAPQCPPPCCTL